jgi:hypothetical protein
MSALAQHPRRAAGIQAQAARFKLDIGGHLLAALAGMAVVVTTLRGLVADSGGPELVSALDEIEGSLGELRRAAAADLPSRQALQHLQTRLAALDGELSALRLAREGWRP